MPEVCGNWKSAQQIAKTGYGQLAFNRIEAEDFYINLKEAIEAEYKLQGYCELIDNLLMDVTASVDNIVYMAIEYAGVRPYKKGETKAIPIPNGLYISYVSWSQIKFGKYVYPMSQVWDKVIECRKRGQRKHIDVIKDVINKQLKEDGDASNRNLANDMIMKPKRERDSIISIANSKAPEITASAEKEASQLKQNGGIVSSTIGTSYFGRKDSIRNQQEVSVGESTVEYLYSQQRKFKQECEKEIAVLIGQNQKSLAKSEEIHDQMCSKTNELQGAWMKSLASATDQLLALKEEFYKHLRTWQQGLYPSEYEQLAERYIELYRIIDLDKVISETMVDAENNTVVLNKLQSLDKSLRIFLHKFETSMNGLGLYVYRAEVGDDFDYVWHMNEDDSIDCSGKKIGKCITPGVAKRVQGDDEDDVIIPALVSI